MQVYRQREIAGLDKVQGAYVGFVDSDDYIEENMYELLMQSIKENDSNVAICNYNTIENGVIKEGIINKPIKSFAIELMTPYGICGYGVNKLYDISLLREVKFNEKVYIWEDTLFNFNIAKNQEVRYSYIDDRLYNYVQNGESALHSVNPEKQVTILNVQNEIVNVLEKVDKNLANERKVHFILTTTNLAYQYKNNIQEYKINEYLNIAKKYLKSGLLKERIPIISKIKIVGAMYFPKLYNIVKERRN